MAWKSASARSKVLAVKTDVTRPNWRECLAARFTAARAGVPRALIRFDDTGMDVTAWHADGSGSKTELRWNEVNGIVAYKRDCFAIDLICMGFTTPQGAVEVNENMDGWNALTDAVPRLLPGTTSKEKWWDNVAQPPFAANATILFSR
jgi:hypothetical protein